LEATAARSASSGTRVFVLAATFLVLTVLAGMARLFRSARW
jgi:hypothetical protein